MHECVYIASFQSSTWPAEVKCQCMHLPLLCCLSLMILLAFEYINPPSPFPSAFLFAVFSFCTHLKLPAPFSVKWYLSEDTEAASHIFCKLAEFELGQSLLRTVCALALCLVALVLVLPRGKTGQGTDSATTGGLRAGTKNMKLLLKELVHGYTSWLS